MRIPADVRQPVAEASNQLEQPSLPNFDQLATFNCHKLLAAEVGVPDKALPFDPVEAVRKRKGVFRVFEAFCDSQKELLVEERFEVAQLPLPQCQLQFQDASVQDFGESEKRVAKGGEEIEKETQLFDQREGPFPPQRPQVAHDFRFAEGLFVRDSRHEGVLLSQPTAPPLAELRRQLLFRQRKGVLFCSTPNQNMCEARKGAVVGKSRRNVQLFEQLQVFEAV